MKERKMGYISLLKSPKKEEEEERKVDEKGSVKGVAIWDDDFEAFLELCDEEKPPQQHQDKIVYGCPLDWEWMDHFLDDDHFSLSETKINDEAAAAEEFHRVLPKSWSSDGDGIIKKKVSLNLNLNYEEVSEAWSGRGSLWAAAAATSSSSSLSSPTSAAYMGEVPRMEEERTRRVLRYKEKRHTRLFSKRIRYQVRKLNAEKRPRIKGRFVKTVS